MKSISKDVKNSVVTLALLLLTGVSNVLLAIPRVATNPGGKSLDQVGDSALSWFFDDVRPWIIVALIVAGALGGWLGGRFKLAIAGTCAGGILTLMFLPWLISKIYGWM